MSPRKPTITYENGRKVFTNITNNSEGANKLNLGFSVELGDEEVGGSAVPSTSIDDRLSLAGLLDSEKERFKEKLLKQHLENLNNDITVPVAPTTSPLINQMKIANDLKHQKETREIKLAEVDTEYKKTDIQTKLKQLELQKQSNSSQDAMLIMMGETYIQNERMIAGFERINANLGELRGTLASINSKFSTVEKHYDFLKDGHPDMKDSNGNVIKPREVEAKKNAEQLIEQKETNETTFDDIEEFFKEAMGQVAEGVESLLGATDGFDLEFNPLKFIDDILVEDYMEQIKKLKK